TFSLAKKSIVSRARFGRRFKLECIESTKMSQDPTFQEKGEADSLLSLIHPSSWPAGLCQGLMK
ncbi:hypothetical protein J6590_077097, partial [Homalodisca vitripennis]